MFIRRKVMTFRTTTGKITQLAPPDFSALYSQTMVQRYFARHPLVERRLLDPQKSKLDV